MTDPTPTRPRPMLENKAISSTGVDPGNSLAGRVAPVHEMNAPDANAQMENVEATRARVQAERDRVQAEQDRANAERDRADRDRADRAPAA